VATCAAENLLIGMPEVALKIDAADNQGCGSSSAKASWPRWISTRKKEISFTAHCYDNW
jgi:hypothetical protein